MYSRLDFLVRLVLTLPVCLFLQRRGVTLHSGKNQEQREAALQSLRDGDVEVLVATDLVSNV
jgi:superfamily II DNA/RNA helicase